MLSNQAGRNLERRKHAERKEKYIILTFQERKYYFHCCSLCPPTHQPSPGVVESYSGKHKAGNL